MRDFNMAADQLIAARAEALFVSDLSMHCHLSRTEVAAAIKDAVRAYGGTRGCAGEVGAAYGDYPETAVERMRWALQVIEATFSPGTRLAGAGGGAARSGGRADLTETGRQL
jgi:SRSO17 transposase